jgi:hypothetical protein
MSVHLKQLKVMVDASGVASTRVAGMVIHLQFPLSLQSALPSVRLGEILSGVTLCFFLFFLGGGRSKHHVQKYTVRRPKFGNEDLNFDTFFLTISFQG